MSDDRIDWDLVQANLDSMSLAKLREELYKNPVRYMPPGTAKAYLELGNPNPYWTMVEATAARRMEAEETK